MYKLKNWGSLEMLANYVGVKVDPDNPRESRLSVAMKLHRLGKYPEAVESMKGEVPNPDDLSMIIAKFGLGKGDPFHFYDGYPEVDEQTD